MKDFRKSQTKEVEDFVSSREGRSENDLFQELYQRALNAKKSGNLKNEQIDDFVKKVSPLLDLEKRARLKALSEEIKKI